MAVNEYAVLDIEKQAAGNVSTYVNITPHFQGRVGDSRASVDVWFKRNGLPLDLTNKTVNFTGVDPSGHKYHAVGWALYDQPGADMQAGRVNFYFRLERKANGMKREHTLKLQTKTARFQL